MGKKKRAFTRGRRRKRKLKRDGVDPKLVKILEEGLGREPTVSDAQKLQLEMAEEVLNRMVQLRIAQWLETIMIILRDEFGFDRAQLALLMRHFMEKTREQTPTPASPFSDNGQ